MPQVSMSLRGILNLSEAKGKDHAEAISAGLPRLRLAMTGENGGNDNLPFVPL